MAIETMSGSLAGSVTEDLALSVKGKVVLENSSDNLFLELNVDGIYGVFSVSPTGEWVYLLDNELKSVQALGSTTVVHDYFLVSSASGQSQARIDIAVQGSNDIASFSGDLQKSLNAKTEEKVAGRILVSDQDLGEKEIQVQERFQGKYGNLIVDKDGAWIYTLSGAERISILDKGKDVSDLLLLSSKDGSQLTIEIQINAKSVVAINQMQGTNNSDNLLGGIGRDSILGLGGDDVIRGNGGDDTIDGGDGLDLAVIDGKFSEFSRSNNQDSFFIKSSVDGNDSATLLSVERLRFQDVNLALDLDGNAGKVAKILGAVFGASSVANRQYMGIGLSYIDKGMSYESLAQLALTAAGADSAEKVVSRLWTNLVGASPNSSNMQPFINMLNEGMSIGSLGVLAAQHPLNVVNIDLVGLATTGVLYTP